MRHHLGSPTIKGENDIDNDSVANYCEFNALSSNRRVKKHLVRILTTTNSTGPIMEILPFEKGDVRQSEADSWKLRRKVVEKREVLYTAQCLFQVCVVKSLYPLVYLGN